MLPLPAAEENFAHNTPCASIAARARVDGLYRPDASLCRRGAESAARAVKVHLRKHRFSPADVVCGGKRFTAIRRRIFRWNKALFRSNALCIARKRNAVPAEKARRRGCVFFMRTQLTASFLAYNKKNRVPIRGYSDPIRTLCMVGVARLELAASWSRTKHATNCATPRYRYQQDRIILSLGGIVKYFSETLFLFL